MSQTPDFRDHPGNEQRAEGHPRIDNAGSDENTDMRRSGGSANDPHGGHQDIHSEIRSHPADPVEELVPAGQASVPAGLAPEVKAKPLIPTESEAESLAFTATQVPNLAEQLNSYGDEAAERSPESVIHPQFDQPGSDYSGPNKDKTMIKPTQPGFGPTELDRPTLGQGNPELGPDPSGIAGQREQAENQDKND